MNKKPGQSFRNALAIEKPLQIVGTINAYCALMAEKTGYRAIYLSGAGVANASYGLPDLGMTSLPDVLEDARRITSVTSLPLLVDIDTGWGSAFTIGRCIKEMIRAGAAAVHIEDQVGQKRCGHRPNKQVVAQEEMVDRIKAAVDARTDESFFVIARTDAFAREGLESCINRAQAYVEAGADGIFIEAVSEKKHYLAFRKILSIPLLANMTEFGKTPLFNKDTLATWGVDMVLYPLSAFRAMNKAAELIFQTIRQNGDQTTVVEQMQTREELYGYLGYHKYEQQLDTLFAQAESKGEKCANVHP